MTHPSTTAVDTKERISTLDILTLILRSDVVCGANIFTRSTSRHSEYSQLSKHTSKQYEDSHDPDQGNCHCLNGCKPHDAAVPRLMINSSIGYSCWSFVE
jgi:hypothetical protein